MIGTIRKHSTWMWVIIITVVIISFVFWGSQTRNGSSSGDTGNFGSINGERISKDNFADAQREVYLRFFVGHHEWPDQDAKRFGFEPERDTYYRLLLIQKQRDLGIHVSSDAIATVAAEILRSFSKRGEAIPPDVFTKQVLQPRGFTFADFERFVRHDLGIQQLIAVTGLPGELVSPREIQALYASQFGELSVQSVFFSASNYLSNIPVTPEAIANFFDLQKARYRLPDRIQVSYVIFAATNFLAEANNELAQVTNLTERIESAYQQLGTNYFKEAKTPAEAKEKVRELFLKDLMQTRARKQANEFATELFALNPARAENLELLAKKKDLKAQVSQPFDREDGPKDLPVVADFTKAAFRLNAEEPFAGPITGEDGAYVIALNKNLPSEIPPLETIREQVTADYKYNEAVAQARKTGEEFYAALTNGLAAGKSFAVVCTETKAHPLLPPPFSLNTRALTNVEEHVSLGLFKQVAFTTPPGKASGLVPTDEGGFVVFVQGKMPLDEARMRADLPSFAHAVRQNRQNEAFNTWFSQEAGRGLRDTPLGQQQQQQTGGAPKK